MTDTTALMAPPMAMSGNMTRLPQLGFEAAGGNARTVPDTRAYLSGENAAGTTSMFSCFSSAPGGEPGGQTPLATA
jgi:hypothetical protein